jgi:c-di-GMP-binding flagellar brake protein YcgR
VGKLDERRKFVRLNAMADVIYRKRDVSEQETLSLSRNIGEGGICLIAYDDLKKADVLDLQIYLPDDPKHIPAVGRVAWVNEFVVGDASGGRRLDVGIEFLEIKEEDRGRIEKYVFTHIEIE